MLRYECIACHVQSAGTNHGMQFLAQQHLCTLSVLVRCHVSLQAMLLPAAQDKQPAYNLTTPKP